MPPSSPCRRIAAVAICLSIAVTGCGDDGDDGATDPVDTTAPSAMPADEPAATDPPSGDAAPIDTAVPTSEAGSGSGSTDPACLQSAWIADETTLQAWFSGFMAGVAEVETVSGRMLLSFDAETYIISTEQVQLVLRVQGTAAVGKLSGASAGGYVATPDGVMSLHPDQNDFRMSAQVAGVEVDMSSSGLPLDEMMSFTTFACGDGTLTLETAAGGTRESASLMLQEA